MSALRADEVDSFRVGYQDEKCLVLAFQAGDQGAYQAIYKRYFPRVFKLCRHMLRDREDAQEAAQETLLRVYQTLGRFNGKYHLGAWINRIGTNICLDHLRARTRRPHDAAVELTEIEVSGPLPDHDPESLYLRRVEGRKLLRGLGELPPLHRAAIVLRAFDGLSYEEIAQALSLTEAQVKALLHRARKSLRRSWTSSVASFLLPARLLRIHIIDGTVGKSTNQTGASFVHHATDIAANAAHVASSCSSLIQHYVESLGARAAPILTAAMVTATAGGAISPALSTPSTPPLTVNAAHDGLTYRPVDRSIRVPVPMKEPTKLGARTRSINPTGTASSLVSLTDTDTSDQGENSESPHADGTAIGEVAEELDADGAGGGEVAKEQDADGAGGGEVSEDPDADGDHGRRDIGDDQHAVHTRGRGSQRSDVPARRPLEDTRRPAPRESAYGVPSSPGPDSRDEHSSTRRAVHGRGH